MNLRRPPLPLMSVTLGFFLLLISSAAASNLSSDTATAPHRGVWETRIVMDRPVEGNPFLDVEFAVVFTLPDQRQVRAEGFFAGNNTWVGRAYCSLVGPW